MGAKQIFHLEAFVAKYMRLYERYVNLFEVNGNTNLTTTAVMPWASISIQRKGRMGCNSAATQNRRRHLARFEREVFWRC